MQISQALEFFENEIHSEILNITRLELKMPSQAKKLSLQAKTQLIEVKMQLIVPSEPWDWPTDSLGTSSAELFKFCAWMPESALKSTIYSRSGIKFSDMYESFLNALDNNGDTIQKAKDAYKNNKNYTCVLYGQSEHQLEPAWNVSQFPREWIASVSGSSSTAGKIRVNLEDVEEKAYKENEITLFGMGDGSLQGETSLPFSKGQCKYVEIYADAWGYIEISPSNWYNSSIVEINAKGPYKSGYSGSKKLATDPEKTTWFFGEDGLLRCILTGIYVALNPTITASVSSDFALELQNKLQPDKKLRVAGLVFSKPDVTFSEIVPKSTASVTVMASKSLSSKNLSSKSLSSKNLSSTIHTTLSSGQEAVLIGATVFELGKQTL